MANEINSQIRDFAMKILKNYDQTVSDITLKNYDLYLKRQSSSTLGKKQQLVVGTKKIPYSYLFKVQNTIGIWYFWMAGDISSTQLTVKYSLGCQNKKKLKKRMSFWRKYVNEQIRGKKRRNIRKLEVRSPEGEAAGPTRGTKLH